MMNNNNKDFTAIKAHYESKIEQLSVKPILTQNQITSISDSIVNKLSSESKVEDLQGAWNIVFNVVNGKYGVKR